jgi:hypothetical protein
MSLFINKDELIIISYSNIRNNKKFIIYGEVNEVCNYFKKFFNNVHIIEQPMPGEKLLKVNYINTNIKNGFILNLLNKFISYFLLNKLNRNKTSVFLKIRDFCSVINYLLMNKTKGKKYFLAVESINCLALIIYKKIFKNDIQIIYFCNDYVPNRYGFFYSKLYNFLDKTCSYNSDYNVLMNILINKYRDNLGFDLNRIRNLYDISGGIVLYNKKENTSSRKLSEKVKLVYATRDIHNGLDFAIRLVYKLNEVGVNSVLTITGFCELKDIILVLNKHNLIFNNNFLVLRGFLDTDELNFVIENSDIGLAFYPDSINSSSYLGDPEKIRRYYNYGLPIIACGAGHNLENIEVNSCGILCHSNFDNIFKNTLYIIKMPEIYNHMSLNSYEQGIKLINNDKFEKFIFSLK